MKILFLLLLLSFNDCKVVERSSFNQYNNPSRNLRLNKKNFGKAFNKIKQFLSNKKHTRKHNRNRMLLNAYKNEIRKLQQKNRRLMGGGGGTNVVVAPSQGPGISNAQVVVNSLGTPPSQAYSGGQVVKGYNDTDADPKVIVTRVKLPGSTNYIQFQKFIIN